jgi:hypothetical protein
MAIHINNSELNKDYVHEGIHRLVLSFIGESRSMGDDVKILLRSKNSELVCFIEDGKEQNEIRFRKKFNSVPSELEQEIVIKQRITPDQPIYAGFLISGRNANGDTASEEFVLHCT